MSNAKVVTNEKKANVSFEVVATELKEPVKQGGIYLLQAGEEFFTRPGKLTNVKLGVKIKVELGYIGIVCGVHEEAFTAFSSWITEEDKDKEASVTLMFHEKPMRKISKGDVIAKLVVCRQ